MHRVLQLFLVAGLSVVQPSHAAVRFAAPASLFSASPEPVRIEGLTAGQRVELVSTAPDWRGRMAIGRATFMAGNRGDIDLGRDAPLAGDYTGVDALGLFWSAKAPTPTVANVPLQDTPLQGTPSASAPSNGTVRLEAFADGTRVAAVVLRTSPSPGALLTDAVPGFPGAIFVRPADAGRHPVIIVLGGSEGGARTAREMSPLLAADGFAVLGLPYYSPGYDPTDRVDGLPTAFKNIPVDRLAAVRDWLRTRPDVDGDRIGVWGASKGAEFALIAASRYDWIKAVVAVVPSDVVWEGWGGESAPAASFAFDGTPLPFVPYVGLDVEYAKAARGEPMDMRRIHVLGRAAYADRVRAARIPIERYGGPLLLIAGEQDGIWPSADMARAIVATREVAGLRTDAVIAADAGHALAGPATEPLARLTVMGGTTVGIAHARRDAWDRTLGLFHAALDAPMK